MIIHLEPDILECEVNWTLGSIITNKASGGDRIPAELFQTLKDDAVKVLHSICQQFGKHSSGQRTGKGQFSFQSQRIGMQKNPISFQCQRMFKLLHNCTHLTEMLKILQARLQLFMNYELPDVPSGFRKGRGTRDQIANICWIMEKAREFQKNIYFFFIDYAKAFVWITTNCGKFFKRWKYQTTFPAF